MAAPTLRVLQTGHTLRAWWTPFPGATLYELVVGASPNDPAAQLLARTASPEYSQHLNVASGNILFVNPSFEANDMEGWGTDSGFWSLSTALAHSGTYSLSVVLDSGQSTNLTSVLYVVTVGNSYAFSVWHNAPANITYTCQAQWFDATGALLSTSTWATAVGAGAWAQATGTVVAPANAAYMAVNVQASATAGAANVGYLDDFTVTGIGQVISAASVYAVRAITDNGVSDFSTWHKPQQVATVLGDPTTAHLEYDAALPAFRVFLDAVTEAVRLGKLNGITDPTFGALSGYGLWTNNVFLTGSINATAGQISGALTFGPNGGWFVGSGTFNAPLTGWRCLVINGVGVMEFWAGGTKQYYNKDDGYVYEANDLLRHGINGIEVLGPIASTTTQSKIVTGVALAADNAGTGTVAWTNPTNAQTVNGVLATAVLTTLGLRNSHYLFMTNPNPNIPSNATIIGIVVELLRKQTGDIGLADEHVYLLKGGVIGVGAVDHKLAAPWSQGSLRWDSFGSPVDLWGYPLTPADLNGSGFGIAVSCVDDVAVTGYIDAPRFTIYYTVPTSVAPINIGGQVLPNVGAGVAVTDAVNYGQITPHGARVYSSATLSVANNTATIVPYNQERFDTDNMHDTVTNTGRIVVQAAGKYLVGANIAWAINGVGDRYVRILLNGATPIASDRRAFASNVIQTHQNVNTIYDCVVGDYFTVEVTQTSGGALLVTAAGNNSDEFWAIRLSA